MDVPFFGHPFNIMYIFTRRQKEKRINPACLSPTGSNGSNGNDYTKNLFTASLASLPTSLASLPTPTSSSPSTGSMQFHPLALVAGGFNARSLGLPRPNEIQWKLFTKKRKFAFFPWKQWNIGLKISVRPPLLTSFPVTDVKTEKKMYGFNYDRWIVPRTINNLLKL